MLRFTTSQLAKKSASPYATTLKAFMDFELIEIPSFQLRASDPTPDPKKLFRLEFELFGNKTPLCTENFARLCTGDMMTDMSEASEAVHEPSFRDQFLPQLSYKQSSLHRVSKDFTVQGGDVTESFSGNLDEDDRRISGSNVDGDDARDRTDRQAHYMSEVGRGRSKSLPRDVQPTVSAFGEEFDAGAELGVVPFDRSGMVGMAVAAPHKNHSQFFILLPEKGAPHLDGTCVCFGRVTRGLDQLKKWQGQCRLNFEGRPLKRVQVANCGML